MAKYFELFPALRRMSAILFVMLAVSPAWASGSTTVVISQMYGAGGNAGATYNADYVELFNLSSSPVSLDGWAIQYGSATGTAIAAVNLLPSGVTLQPGQRYLVSGTPGTTGAALPVTADAVVSTIALGAAAGRVFLTNSTTQLASSCPGTGGTVVDFIGYGTTDTCYEGSGAAPAPSATLADIRTNACTDTDNNASDFSTGAPAPRNSASTTTPCVGPPVALALTAAIAPSPVNTSSATLLTATVTPATQPASTGLVVTADTSALGGSTTQPLYDDGTHGDVTANDSIYSYSLTVPANQAANTYTVNFKASDTQLRSATGSASVVVHLASVAYTSVVLTASTTTAVAGNNVSLSAAVSGNQSAKPNGTITFMDGTTALNTPMSLSNGIATYSTTALSVGTHTITAFYTGDTVYPNFTSNPVTVSITAAPVPDFTLALANTSLIVSSAIPTNTSTVYVSMLNGFSQTVSLSCTGLPASSACLFAPASLSASGSSTLTVGINGKAALQKPAIFGRGGMMLAFSLFGLPLLVLRRRIRSTLRIACTALGALLLACALIPVTGCGNSSSIAAGNSTVTVTATGGNITHTTTFTLIVQ